ncbi:MAG: zinc ABC transporter substrate-binding protein [Clostridia bacterium]|jgi:zinc transport system substrate-binding protein|nr:zinc ABC transporter substrate-binding protein [Clostridia bacterium]MDH7573174.1 zinc ABC transporter substrate-binding protein [Clostridia bacterium]
MYRVPGRPHLVLVLLLAVFLAVSGCGSRTASTGFAEKPLVCATIYPLYDFAAKLAGDRATVRLLLPPGADVHEWEPGVEVLRALQQADLLVYNGAGLEPWVERVVASADSPRLRTVEASKGIELLPLSQEEAGAQEADSSVREAGAPLGRYDPHLWLDPRRARQQAANILEGLVAADSAGRDYYTARYRVLARRLEQLDFLYRTLLEGRNRHTFVVSHAAFGYLASRYGLEQIALTGAHAEAEPGPRELVQVVDLARRLDLRYVFVDELHGRRVAQALARELGAEVLSLHPLASLTAEELAAGEDYFSLMEENLVQLYRGLE